MVPVMSTSDSSVSQQITYEIKGIDELVDAIEKDDTKVTAKKVLQLLVMYILAMMSKDTAAAQQIQDEITQSVNSLSDVVEKGNQLKSDLKTEFSDPKNQTASALSMLDQIYEKLNSIFQTMPKVAI